MSSKKDIIRRLSSIINFMEKEDKGKISQSCFLQRENKFIPMDQKHKCDLIQSLVSHEILMLRCQTKQLVFIVNMCLNDHIGILCLSLNLKGNRFKLETTSYFVLYQTGSQQVSQSFTKLYDPVSYKTNYKVWCSGLQWLSFGWTYIFHIHWCVHNIRHLERLQVKFMSNHMHVFSQSLAPFVFCSLCPQSCCFNP